MMSESTLPGDLAAYSRQGFGAALTAQPPYALLIVDFVNGFADPAVFGGGNIPAAIARTSSSPTSFSRSPPCYCSL